MIAEPNTWLISNSSFYFVDGLIKGEFPLNAYNIFDLTKLSESLLLSDKLVTLPGIGTEIETYGKLKNDNRIKIEELDVNDGIMENIVGLVRGGGQIHKKFDKDQLVTIFSDIFQVKDKTIEYVDSWKKSTYANKKLILDAISWTPEWGNRNWSSTYKHMDEWFHSTIHSDVPYLNFLKTYSKSANTILNKVSNSSVYNSHFQELITDTYLRTILYLEIASQYQLNYSPDSIRVPLVEYIDSVMLNEAKKIGQALVERYGDNNDDSKKNFDDIAFGVNEIRLPILGIVINKMSRSKLSRKDFLNTVLELREEKKVKNIRQILRVLDKAVKGENMNDIKQWEKIKKQLNHKTANGHADSLFIKINNVLDKFRPALAAVALTTGLSFDSESIGLSIAALGYAPGFVSYFKNRRFTLLKDLNKEVNQIVYYNDKLEKIFDSKLSGGDINLLRKLNASQKKYLRVR